MPEARSLPIPAGHREFTVKVDGEAVPREHPLLSVTITRTVNRIPSARLAFIDGSASSGAFPLSDGDLFVPGRKVEILAGTVDEQVPLFTGVVVRQSIRIRERSAAQLVVDCRHPAFKLAVGRRSVVWADRTDSDILGEVLDRAGIAGEVDATPLVHEQMVQRHATDWDFLLSRAEANGKLVFTRGDTLVITSPDLEQAPVCTLHFGATILDFDAELDARTQPPGVRGVTWDPAQQELLGKDAEPPAFEGPGNLTGDALSEVGGDGPYELRHGSLAEEEAQSWADAQWQRARLNKVSGRARCEGIGTVEPGTVVRLSGVGARFGGDVYVTGVRHDHDTVQGWKTHVQFGNVPSWSEARQEAPSQGGLVPSVTGLQVGKVLSNEDPRHEHRVRVRLPLVSTEDEGLWARVAAPDAGPDRGLFIRPEEGDEVVVGFLEDDPRAPVLLGMMHSSARPAPLEGSDDNHEKLYRSRSGIRIHLDDDRKVLAVETPGGNRLTLSDEDGGIKLEDLHGNALELNASGITLKSTSTIALEAASGVSVEPGTSFAVSGASEVKLEGSGSAELSSSGTTTIKGSLVQLN